MSIYALVLRPCSICFRCIILRHKLKPYINVFGIIELWPFSQLFSSMFNKEILILLFVTNVRPGHCTYVDCNTVNIYGVISRKRV